MSENAQRVGILLIAITFLVTTVGIGLYAILFNDSNSSEQLSQQEIQDLIDKQKEQPVEQRTIDGFVPVAEVNELKTEDLIVGTGQEATASDTITVDYVGVLAATGAGFDNSIDRGQPATFPLNQVISGWQQGIPGMKEGGKRRLYIPADLAYGAQGSGDLIPPNSALVFDVTLIKVGE